MIRRLFWMGLITVLVVGCGSESAEQGVIETESGDERPGATTSSEASDEIVRMSAEDGWVVLHELEVPGPGRARLVVDGETVEFEIECHGPGVIDDSVEVPPIMASRLFNAQFSGEGRLANNHRVTISGYRRVVNEDEARRDLRFYRYPGMDRASIDLTVFDEEGRANASFQGGPNDQNRTGAGLPLLHVQPDGSFTAVTEMVSAATMIPGTHNFHQHALAGPVELAGRCPQPWSESPLPGGMRAMF